MKDLKHPNIIQLVDSFLEISGQSLRPGNAKSAKGYLHIIMEYADCGDLY